MRFPVAFVPHGGGPWPFVDIGMPRDEVDGLAGYLQSVARLPPSRPVALLVVSGHWEAATPTSLSSPAPPLLYDYSGFPPEAYTITWPAPGHPKLAARVQQLVAGAGFTGALDSSRGFDHGTFVPMKVAYPEADVPVVQLSLMRGLDPERHLAIGRALAPLRDEDVFIIGSGMTFHNLRAFFAGGDDAPARAEAFDAWLRDTMTRPPEERHTRLTQWSGAPHARFAHPREEHLMPLMVSVGAADGDAATVAYNGTMFGLRHSAFHFG